MKRDLFITRTVLLCYAHKDKGMASKLYDHLSALEHSCRIAVWDYGHILGGEEWRVEMDKYLESAQIILLLISSSFLASKYCYREEMLKAIRRHESKEDVRVIPIILRPVVWNIVPLDKLKPLPEDAIPITEWSSHDKGYMNVVQGIMKVLAQMDTHSLPGPTAERGLLMTKIDRLAETVRVQMKPEVRANSAAETLRQLSVLVPIDVTLADLVVGWRTLSQASQQGDGPAIVQRRVTCGELADMAAQLTADQGDLGQAIKTWDVWANAFKNSNDPRQDAMTKTFVRELAELRMAAASP